MTTAPQRRPGTPRPALSRGLAAGLTTVLLLGVPAVTLPAAATADVAAGPAAEAEPSVVVVEEDGDGLAVRTVAVDTVEQAEDLAEDLRSEPDVVAADVDRRVRAAGDPLRDQQWALDTLRAEATWARRDATGQVVAVIDSGVQRTHPDLAGVVLPGLDLVDPRYDGGSDPNGHGTHVAGIVAAVVDNGVGTAGMARGAQVLPVRVLDADGWGYASDTAAGIIWAADQGADVINLSLGGDYPDSATAAAVAYALDQDVVVVASVGNEYEYGNPVTYPAALPGVIGVTAVDSRLRWAPFANRGSYVDLAAPGVDIVSLERRGGYVAYDGTSMAAPYVSAVAALVRAKEPALKDWQVASRLNATARDIGPAGRDQVFGYGVVDPRAAFDAGEPQLGPMALSGPTAAVAPTGTATFSVSWTGGRRPATGTVVSLQQRTGSTWTTRARATVTTTSGSVPVVLTAVRPGSYRVATNQQVSGSRTLVVKATLSSLSTARSGSTFTVRGNATPYLAKTVVLQRWNGSSYSEVARTTATTGFRLSHTMTRPTNQYRVKVVATATTTEAYSTAWTVRR
ncbi:S8 family serine peptidase [Jannaschia sp. R86511]|uniref:S8 family serine peptidase n=1 Tax=Jannaschia sp. R86511 TaxID=3093853 RepID=UPI0036D2586A